VEGTAVAAPVSSPHVQFTSPFAAVASVSRASSVAEEDAESRRACCQVWTQIWLCDKNCCHGTCHQQTLHACSGSLLKATLYASAHATTWRPTDRVAVMMQRIAVRGGTAVQWDRWSRQRDRVTAASQQKLSSKAAAADDDVRSARMSRSQMAVRECTYAVVMNHDSPPCTPNTTRGSALCGLNTGSIVLVRLLWCAHCCTPEQTHCSVAYPCSSYWVNYVLPTEPGHGFHGVRPPCEQSAHRDTATKVLP